MPVVELERVSKSFGRTAAVRDITFRAGPGEALCLFGPSGCGKTTTLRLIAGLDEPDTGTVRVASDAGVETNAKDVSIGMVFQDLALWPHMRAERHLDFVLRSVMPGRTERRARVREVLQTCRLGDQRRAYPGRLSGGEQQRLAIARAIAADPALLLLDEPFANLDDALRDHFIAEFKRRKEAGATIVFATHDRAEADALADRVLLMQNGRAVTRDAPTAAP